MNRIKKTQHYKWVILCICFLMTFVTLGFCSSNKGLYLSAITQALGIKRSLFSISDSCRFISSAVINLFFGVLVQKHGVRKMTAFGFLCVIASILLYAFSAHILLFYLGGTLLGIGLSFTTNTMTSCIVRRWFHRDIGRYTGIVMAANGIGGAVAAQMITPLLNQEGNPFGYRDAYLMVVGILVVTGILVISLLREAPGSGDTPAVTAKKKPRGTLWSGVTLSQLKSRPYFYLAGLCVFLTGFMLQGIGGIYISHLLDVGFDPNTVAAIAGAASLTLTVSKLLVGLGYDRFGLRLITLLCQLAAVVAFFLLSFMSPGTAGTAGAGIFAVLHALALPLETLVIPLIVGDLFGSAAFEKLLGIFIAMNYAGYALGGPLINLSYDLLGTYQPVLILCGCIMLATCVLMQFVITAADKDKRNIIQKEESQNV